jgi:hypothetical protein
VVVRGEGSFDGRADSPVVPNGGGEGEQAGGDAGVDARQGASAVGFEGELAFESVDDRLDPLAAPGELAEPGGLVFAVGADQVRSQAAGDEGLEVFAGEALVAEDDLPGADQVVTALQQGGNDLAFAYTGAGPR